MCFCVTAVVVTSTKCPLCLPFKRSIAPNHLEVIAASVEDVCYLTGWRDDQRPTPWALFVFSCTDVLTSVALCGVSRPSASSYRPCSTQTCTRAAPSALGKLSHSWQAHRVRPDLFDAYHARSLRDACAGTSLAAGGCDIWLGYLHEELSVYLTGQAIICPRPSLASRVFQWCTLKAVGYATVQTDTACRAEPI